jgi:hypothetical protein
MLNCDSFYILAWFRLFIRCFSSPTHRQVAPKSDWVTTISKTNQLPRASSSKERAHKFESGGSVAKREKMSRRSLSSSSPDDVRRGVLLHNFSELELISFVIVFLA